MKSGEGTCRPGRVGVEGPVCDARGTRAPVRGWSRPTEERPWPTLKLIVSLEAIFLSTFVMIGQNRQAAFQQEKADHDFNDVNTLLVENTALTRTIHE